MKKAWVVASVLALASAAAFAEAPSDASVHLAAIFAQPAAGSCAAKIAGALPLARGGPGVQSTCEAVCTPYANISCTAPGDCSAADRNCDIGQRGFVTCTTGTTYCGPECDPCEGLFGFCRTCCLTGDCFACCRCDGGGTGYCAMIC